MVACDGGARVAWCVLGVVVSPATLFEGSCCCWKIAPATTLGAGATWFLCRSIASTRVVSAAMSIDALVVASTNDVIVANI